MKKECRKLKTEDQENGDASNIVTTIFVIEGKVNNSCINTLGE